MIRIKYCDRWPGGGRYTAARCFERLTDNIGNPRNRAEPPLRDTLSKAYLHASMGAHMVKEDWFSVVLKDGKRIPMYALPRKDRFVLAALYDSRTRKNPGIALESLDFVRWRFLANQEFDIWLTITDYEIINLDGNLTGYEPCVIMNFPFYGKSVEATVLPVPPLEANWADLCWEEKYEEIHDPCHLTENALCIGADGHYYTNYWRLKSAFWNAWLKDIEKTKEMLSCKWKNDRRWYLTDITRELTADSFVRMFAENGEEVYLSDAARKPWLGVPCRIITHMVSAPCAAPGTVNVWRIFKREDGSYYLCSRWENAFAGICSTVCEALEKRMKDFEFIELLVQEERILSWNFTIICGLKIREDCIEIFENNLAAKMFYDALDEAWQSGHCKMRTSY
ncbi:MAG: hypothetical protein LUG93_01090 [Lachnospiraceae bacterium]|nr:hypothetical protein [Lachnospiraceae bacterium]